MTQAQKHVQAAEKAVDEARVALANASTEARTLAAREQDVAAAIRQAIDESVRAGKTADVGDAHATLRALQDQRSTAETVAHTLVDVVREREQALAAARVADFPELRSALVKRAAAIAERVADVHARYAAELAPLEAETGQVEAEWNALRQTLPRAVTGTFRLEMVDLDIPNIEPHTELAKFDTRDPSLPAWLAPVIEQSRRLVEQQNPPIPVGIPVAP